MKVFANVLSTSCPHFKVKIQLLMFSGIGVVVSHTFIPGHLEIQPCYIEFICHHVTLILSN